MLVQDWLGEDNKLGIDIWEKKYRYNEESFDDWIIRVSGNNEDVAKLILEKKFLFGGRILSNRGLNKHGIKTTLSNCYVITPPEDNIESIFECATKLARTYSYGGGCGVDISKLAPRGAKVNNTAKETSGSVSFMDLYSLVTELIGQNGRRGALMISLDCTHPDLEEFIEIKSDLNKVTKANISIKITDEFMDAVKNKERFKLSFIRNETGESIEKEVDAYEIFYKFCKMNWSYAEPAMLFWDRIENWNMLSEDKNFKYAGTNPCAEEPLPAGGSCLLGSINLSEFVVNKKFNMPSFINTVQIAVNALNDVLDEGLLLHPLKEQRDSVRDWRQIGLGIFGLADMLIKMGIEYGSEESLTLCDEIAHVMAEEAIVASYNYGVKNDKSYPNFNSDAVLNSKYFNEHCPESLLPYIKSHGLANSQLLTIAPTGTLSTMLGVSGGIEPIFANYYTRKTESLHGEDKYYKVYTPIVQKYMEEHGLEDDSELPNYFITSQNLDYKARINMQSIWQNHIDASISSTVNVPNEFTIEDVEDLYMYAWKKGLKGVTIYRAGCERDGVLVDETKSKPTEPNTEETTNKNKTIPRGVILAADDCAVGKKRKLTTGCGSLHCSAFFDPITGDLLETYLSKGSTGGCNNFMIGLSRMISLASRAGTPIEAIIDQLNSCGSCPSYAVRKATKKDTSKGSCCPIAIGYALKDMHDEMMNELFSDCEEEIEVEIEVKHENKESVLDENKIEDYTPCPTCGEPLVFEGGCNSCKACGWSKCDL